jgi:hypothetical protein
MRPKDTMYHKYRMAICRRRVPFSGMGKTKFLCNIAPAERRLRARKKCLVCSNRTDVKDVERQINSLLWGGEVLEPVSNH